MSLGLDIFRCTSIPFQYNNIPQYPCARLYTPAMQETRSIKYTNDDKTNISLINDYIVAKYKVEVNIANNPKKCVTFQEKQANIERKRLLVKRPALSDLENYPPPKGASKRYAPYVPLPKPTLFRIIPEKLILTPKPQAVVPENIVAMLNDTEAFEIGTKLLLKYVEEFTEQDLIGEIVEFLDGDQVSEIMKDIQNNESDEIIMEHFEKENAEYFRDLALNL